MCSTCTPPTKSELFKNGDFVAGIALYAEWTAGHDARPERIGFAAGQGADFDCYQRRFEKSARGGNLGARSYHKSVRGLNLVASDIHAHNTFADPRRVEPREVNVTQIRNPLVYSFPPASVTRLDIELV
jgi:hypothetical protein